MSSEESAEEDGEEILTVKPLTWRAEIVNKMMADLDIICKKDKSPQSRRQLKTRKTGEASIYDHHRIGLQLGVCEIASYGKLASRLKGTYCC